MTEEETRPKAKRITEQLEPLKIETLEAWQREPTMAFRIISARPDRFMQLLITAAMGLYKQQGE